MRRQRVRPPAQRAAGRVRFEAIPSPGTVADPGDARLVFFLALDDDPHPDLLLVNSPAELPRERAPPRTSLTPVSPVG